ncbi:tail completion protein gp17 [Sporosarcina sp. FSL K6-3457]|uniref:tail completion protein gp17 n=1 Tax=Sporosarcina sp. FSL K6-3457 TaxID=2978204 RepID=UPI0030F6AE00
MIAVDLRNHLLAQPRLKELLDTRVHPGWIPENATMPSVAYLEISGARHHNIDVAFPRYQFSVFSTRYTEAKEIEKEIRYAFQRFKGNMGSTRIIQGVYENSVDQYEDRTKLYHIAIDFKFIYREE